ncbi:hypothetical protein TNCV_375921 [Trichonephila clavipes]|nr:hypothetical protein TNCV_375921 [Trichonephila clavipes]
MTLFTRTLEETDLDYRSHFSCHRLQKNMERFTNTELADMHLIFGLTEGNAREAERLYHKKYPQRDAPTRQMFTNLPTMSY